MRLLIAKISAIFSSLYQYDVHSMSISTFSVLNRLANRMSRACNLETRFFSFRKVSAACAKLDSFRDHLNELNK